LYYEAKTGNVHAINGSGKSAAALTLDEIRARGIDTERFPFDSPLAITVPGTVGAWDKIHGQWGSGRVDLSQVLQASLGRP
jgi:gamma-glutamyltranspeptidase/glutathione hydrolase